MSSSIRSFRFQRALTRSPLFWIRSILILRLRSSPSMAFLRASGVRGSVGSSEEGNLILPGEVRAHRLDRDSVAVEAAVIVGDF